MGGWGEDKTVCFHQKLFCDDESNLDDAQDSEPKIMICSFSSMRPGFSYIYNFYICGIDTASHLRVNQVKVFQMVRLLTFLSIQNVTPSSDKYLFSFTCVSIIF